MIGVFFSLLTMVALGGIAIYIILKMMRNFQPGRTKIQKDLQQMKAELKPWIADLVPWSREEMEQLSFNEVNKSSKKRVVNTVKGIFTTIYHEPVIAYSYKNYLARKENALLYVRTSEHEFIYRIKTDQTELVIDNELVGNIHANGTLYSYKSKKPLAQINRDSLDLQMPISVNSKELGRLVNPGKVKRSNARAFEFLADMKKDEEKLFLSLSILELIKQKA